MTAPVSFLPFAILGLVVGVFIGCEGTGGPLLLIPILVWLKLPVLTAVGLGQVIQLPIAALLVLGVMAGARLAHGLPAILLTRFVAGVLIVMGVAMSVRILYTT